MDKLVEELKKDLETGRQLHKHGFQVAILENDLVELLAHIERLEAEKASLIVSMGHLEERVRKAEHELIGLSDGDLVAVPVEPTQEMIDAANKLPMIFIIGDEYRVMIKAAKEPHGQTD